MSSMPASVSTSNSSFNVKVAAVAVLLVVLQFVHLTMGDEKYNQRIRQAVGLAVDLVEKSATEYLNHRECFSCHHQAMPLIALNYAQRRGVSVDQKVIEAQVKHTLKHFQKNKQRYLDGQGTGGQVDTAGYGLWGLQSAEVKTNQFTDAVVDYLLKRDRSRGHWRRSSERPPSEASNLTATYVAIKALNHYGGAKDPKLRGRIDKAHQWALQQKPQDTEDWVFKLRITHELKSPKELQSIGETLLKQQRPDGGWSQTDQLASDAYATATTLVALSEAKVLQPDDARFRAGVSYLLKSQKPDGSWHVKSRSSPFQEYFESGFPHQKDQFISITATCWAIMALSEAIEKR